MVIAPRGRCQGLRDVSRGLILRRLRWISSGTTLVQCLAALATGFVTIWSAAACSRLGWPKPASIWSAAARRRLGWPGFTKALASTGARLRNGVLGSRAPALRAGAALLPNPQLARWASIPHAKPANAGVRVWPRVKRSENPGVESRNVEPAKRATEALIPPCATPSGIAHQNQSAMILGLLNEA